MTGTEPPQEPAGTLLEQQRTQARRAYGEITPIGRRLLRVRRTAGFDQLDSEWVVRSSDFVGIATVLHISLSSWPHPFVSRGKLSEEEADLALAALEHRLADPEALLRTTEPLVSGAKPL